MILNGLSAIKLYKVNIASCICDGNKAQKKAFSFAWTESLRFKDSWLKGIIFIPCLCHRIDNGYKYHVTHDPALKEIIERIKSYPAILNEHRNEIGAKCPPPVSTRWLYDFDIIAFILKHKDKAHKYVELNESKMNLYKVLLVFKSLLKIFENPNTYFELGGKGDGTSGYDITAGDLDGGQEVNMEGPGIIPVYILDKNLKRTTEINETQLPIMASNYGTSKLLHEEQGKYTGADIYMAADGTWRYKAEHMRLPILRSRY